jgi:tetraacyldisaccharide 4'-kinase
MIRKILLFPFTLIYGSGVLLRNLLFDAGVFSTVRYEKPLILVGNLSTGGTGKSPMIRFLAEHLRMSMHTVILSRGYGRRSKGVIVARDTDGSPAMIGDEPAMYLNALSGVEVVCSGDRRAGVRTILQRFNDAGVILMDDGYQHRWVDPGLKILLTAYHRPYFNDMLLPSGDLREFRSGSGRADIIVVTKCPDHMSDREMDDMKRAIAPKAHQKVFFAGLGYGDVIHGMGGTSLDTGQLASSHVLMVTGIADPSPMEQHLRSVSQEVSKLVFPDHHRYNEKDVSDIKMKFGSISGGNKIIVTTEKDIVRMKEAHITEHINDIYCLPVRPVIREEGQFLKLIDEYTAAGA